jgi:glutaredoxin
MRTLRFLTLLVVIATCFVAGLYGAPLGRSAYARLFPEPAFRIGDYSKLHDEAGSTVVLFSTSTCPYCKKTRELLNGAHVSFVDYDIESSEAGKAKFKQLGGVGVPLLYVGNREIHGFREVAIKDALAQLVQKRAPNT